MSKCICENECRGQNGRWWMNKGMSNLYIYVYIIFYWILILLLYSCVFVSASCLDNCRDELPAGSAGVASHHWIHCSAGHHADPRNEQKKPIKKPIFWVPPVIVHVDRNFQ